MVNQQYIKLGAIGLSIVAISLGIGMGVSTRNKKKAAINVAKSTSTDSDLPWCPEETRRELIVLGTENIHAAPAPANENLRRGTGTGTVRNLGLTFQPDTPTPTTYMPTNADDFLNPPISTPFPSDLTVTKPTNPPMTAEIMKGTSSPSIAPSSAKPSAAVIVSVQNLSSYDHLLNRIHPS